jgi:hypothetical protein
MESKLKLLTAVIAVFFTVQAWASDTAMNKSGKEYSPFLNQNFPNQVYWGDTHVHTNISMDSGLFGNKLGPKEAYRFARGEAVMASGGYKAKLAKAAGFSGSC